MSLQNRCPKKSSEKVLFRAAVGGNVIFPRSSFLRGRDGVFSACAALYELGTMKDHFGRDVDDELRALKENNPSIKGHGRGVDTSPTLNHQRSGLASQYPLSPQKNNRLDKGF